MKTKARALLRRAVGAAGLWAIGAAVAGQDFIVADSSREAFSQPFAGLGEAAREQFLRGRSLFHQNWVVAPAKDSSVSGLGPLYNRLSCVACHARNGRGQPPEAADERMRSMLVRLSVPGRDGHGGPRPHPAYGGQFNEEGIPGVAGEGLAALSWIELAAVPLADGAAVGLRRPVVEFRELAYGPLDGVLTSPRVGPQVFGLGLLDAVPERALRRRVALAKPDGVTGKLNLVWDPRRGRGVAGRFGYKANMPSLRVQIAGAAQGDLGLTSALFPAENCMPAQTSCVKAKSGRFPELSRSQLDDMEFYFAHLAVPERRGATRPEVLRGQAMFAALGCAACHLPELKTGAQPRFATLANQTIHPYTDLLLHDMGDGLADGRPDYRASGREWRTAPLWGIGLTEQVSQYRNYLHDGRARSLSEAILWHGGEARPARERFAALQRAERQALLEFLESL